MKLILINIGFHEITPTLAFGAYVSLAGLISLRGRGEMKGVLKGSLFQE